MKRLINSLLDLLLKSRLTDSFDIFESKIDGEFRGWSGNTLFALVNGQIWQQSSDDLTYHHANSPRVLIYRSGPAIKMHVEGVDRTIFVKRIR